jgi:GT2 family glycosyltransferase
MNTQIIIPVRNELHLTQSLCEQLKEQSGWDVCWIFNNGSIDGTADYLYDLWKEDKRFQYVEAPEYGIYEMWDRGFWLACKFQADHVAILNNDIVLFPNTFNSLNNAMAYNKDAWIVYPDYNATIPGPINYRVTKGTYRHGGMSGFCFMLRAEKIDWDPLVDPEFIWYGGDDDIAFNVEERGGQQVRVTGLPLTHLHEGTARHYNLGKQKHDDMEYLKRKWNK